MLVIRAAPLLLLLLLYQPLRGHGMHGSSAGVLTASCQARLLMPEVAVQQDWGKQHGHSSSRGLYSSSSSVPAAGSVPRFGHLSSQADMDRLRPLRAHTSASEVAAHLWLLHKALHLVVGIHDYYAILRGIFHLPSTPVMDPAHLSRI